MAPQNDICPQGSTYPMKAAPIVANKINTPDTQTIGIFAGELKYIPRPMCVYIRIKNNDAPFICRYRIIQPLSMSRIMWITESKASSVDAT